MRNKAGWYFCRLFSYFAWMLIMRKRWLDVLCAIVCGWGIYCYNPFQLYFQNDDFTHILLSSQHQLFQRNSFRPVCDLSVMLDTAVWGKNAVGYHLTNLVLHIICSILVFIFSRNIFRLYYSEERKTVFPLITAVLFFIYPSHSEGVFWILGRSGTLGAIFSLLFLIFFLKENLSRTNTLLSLIFYAVALLTYESVWVLPVIGAILMVGANGTAQIQSRRNVLYLMGAIFLVYLFYRWRTNHEIIGHYEGQNFYDFSLGILFTNYFKLIVRCFTSYRETSLAISIGFCLATLSVLFFFFKNIRLGKPVFILLCLFISLLPYLSVGIDTHGTEGERYLYLPSIFVCLFITMVFCVTGKPVFTTGLVILLCVVYCAQLYINAGNYRFAGQVVRQTVDQIEKEQNKNIIIQELPRAQYGALILENGLTDAVDFFGIKKNNVSISVISQRSETKPLLPPYRIIISPDAVYDETSIKYVFTDTAMIIYR